MNTDTHLLTRQEKELVALGASVGAGCHDCFDYHLEAARKAELGADRVLTAITSAQRVSAQAAKGLERHMERRLELADLTPSASTALDTELSALGAAIAANDRTNIDRHVKAAAALGVSSSRLQAAVDVANTVQVNAAAIHLRAAHRSLERLPAPETEPTSFSGDCGDCGCDGNAGSGDLADDHPTAVAT